MEVKLETADDLLPEWLADRIQEICGNYKVTRVESGAFLVFNSLSKTLLHIKLNQFKQFLKILHSR